MRNHVSALLAKTRKKPEKTRIFVFTHSGYGTTPVLWGGGNRYVEGEPRTFGYLMLYETFPLLTIGYLMFYETFPLLTIG